jgi:hypothetical protein
MQILPVSLLPLRVSTESLIDVDTSNSFVLQTAIPEEVRRQAASDPDFNPYLVDDPHDVLIWLRLDEEYANKFIFNNTNKLEAGHYLGKLQELCCVRRTYTSIVNGEVLGKDIPASYTVKSRSASPRNKHRSISGPLRKPRPIS